MTEPFNPINPIPKPKRSSSPATPSLAILLVLAVGLMFVLIIVVTAIAVTLLRPAPEEAKPAVGITKISTTPTTEAPTTTTTEAPTTTRRVTTTTEDPVKQARAVLLVTMCGKVGTTTGGLNYCDTKIAEPGYIKLIKSGCDLIDLADPKHTKSRDTIVTSLAATLIAAENTGQMTKAEGNDVAALLGGVLDGRDDLCP